MYKLKPVRHAHVIEWNKLLLRKKIKKNFVIEQTA